MSGRKSAKRRGKVAHPPRDLIGLLPCVKEPEKPGADRNFWTVVPTGHYDWDNFLGAGLANQVLKTMRSGGHYELLNRIIRDMIAGGTFDGLEVGFMSEIAMEIAKRDIMAKRLTD
jgi:hypothetical protein